MANYKAQRRFTEPGSNVLAAARYALRRMARKDVYWEDRQISFTVPMSWWSWGEKVTIDLEDDGSVTVISKCVFQLFDWGKNKRNVEGLLDWMEEYFELHS